MDRVVQCNTAPINPDGSYVLYWMTSYRRRHFNFALQRAVFWANELRKPLYIFEPISCCYRWASTRFHSFVIDGMRENRRAFAQSPVTYAPFVEQSPGEGKRLLSRLVRRACLIVTDDFPAFEIPGWISSVSARSAVLMEKVDSNGLFPMRATERLFLTAAGFRRFLEKQPRHEFPLRDPLARMDLPRLSSRIPSGDATTIPKFIDQSVRPIAGLKGGTSPARAQLRGFISGDSMSSGLSPYLHFGHISVHEVHEAVTSSRRPGAERFLDELITWRELGFNRCALTSDYDQYNSLPEWARNTLAKHATDPRPVVYSIDQMEKAETHDALWNSAQQSLVTEGRIENRLRMLWGKKIIEWSATPQVALDTMIHLNNKYALDGRDPNSYTGIFWTLGRYDRPWGPERPIFGLVRYMSSASTAKKLRRGK